MKLKTYLLLVFSAAIFLCTFSNRATADVLNEGWHVIEGEQVTLDEANQFYQVQQSAKRTSLLSTFSAQLATTVTPEIQNLARALQHDPKLIYDYIHNHIHYTPYYGAMKGAALTLFDRSANDFDQAALMIALLRESGYTAQFVIGTQTIPGDDLADWLGGLENSPNNSRSNKISQILSGGGIPFTFAGLGDGTAHVSRVWVKVNIDGVDYVFDPAFKSSVRSFGSMDEQKFISASGYQFNDVIAAVTNGATLGSDYVQNLNETGLRNKLAEYSSAIVNTIRNEFPNEEVFDVYGGMKIVQTNLNAYQTFLPVPSSIISTVDEIPVQYHATLRIQLAGIDKTFNTVDIGEKRLTVTFAAGNFRPELRLDGALIVQGNTTIPNNNYDATITINHPYAALGGTYADQTAVYTFKSGNNIFAIIKTFGRPGDKLIAYHQAKLNESLHAGLSEISEEVMGETLNLIGLTYDQERFDVQSLIALNSPDAFTIHHHGIGLVEQTESVSVDFKQGVLSRHSIGPIVDDWALKSLFESGAAASSALEHVVLEQITDPENPAASTVNMLQNANQNGYKIFKAKSNNFSSISPQLQGYPSSVLTHLQSQVNNGREFILAQHGNLNLGGAWHGFGYIDYDDVARGAVGFVISGGLNGGYASDPGVVPPTTVSNFIKTIISDISTKISTNSYQSRDPVDMASGAFVFDHVDLALGGSGPTGLSFNRSYNSSNYLLNRNFGFGWTHSYDIYHKRTGQGGAGLGRRTPADAAAVFAALWIANDVLHNRNDALGWMTVVLIQKWAMEQLIKNTVVVHFGSEIAEFIKLPDGTYISPPGTTSKLVDNGNGTFSLLERFGARMDFDANGRIERLRDADGNEAIFTYSGDKLSTVRDAFNRTLTFSYSGDKLSSVSDSEGRSVGYGYDGNNDLVSYTDPEGNIWTYNYDALHRMTSLKNPLNITTAANTYDNEGRVETQTVPRQGGQSAIYNFYFSGFRNTEEDPFGKQMIYHLDEMGRTIKLENELGFTNRIVFDGQNHEIQTTDPRNNSTFLNYNGDHNVASTKNALNEESFFRYDSELRLKETENPLQHINYFDYDTEHHLIQTTDAENIDTDFNYFANGQLQYAVDGRDITTTFFYDNFGHPQSTQVALHPPVQFEFDAIGRNKELTDNENAQTLFDYDKRNLPLKITDPLLKEIVYTYDDAGRMLTRKDRNNDTTVYSYTPSGKIDTITYPDLSTVGFIYNLHDQLTDMTDSLGTTHFERDALYRITSVTDPYGFTVSYQYDEANNVTKITYPGNKDVIYVYDALNRLKTITNWLGQTATYAYDEAGRLTDLTHFNGMQTTYNYDNANRLTFLEHKNITTDSVIARYAYTLDGNGNRTSIQMLAPLMPAINTANELYTYNPKKNRLLQAGGISFTYDDEGQLETKGGVSYNFDFEHRLTSVGSSTYAYNGVGSRLRAMQNNMEIRYIYDLAGNLLAEANSNNEIIGYYIHGLGLLAMITPEDETFSYHYDGTGNTVAITDESKQVQNTYAYTPFGVITENEVFDQPFTFSGEHGVIQDSTGLYYMRARYYDPSIGRFISEDPIRFEGGDVNLYAYTGNNPINRVDPSGFWYIDINIGIGWWGGVGTGGVILSDKGIYSYVGGGVGSPGPSGGLAWSPSDPTPGWNYGVQGGYGAGGQYGIDNQGNQFWEVGLVSPGLSGIAYYVEPVKWPWQEDSLRNKNYSK